MTPPVLSFRPGAGVVVDLDHLVRSRMLVQANSGGGKSRALRYLLEQTHGRVQHIVFDPEGEFASLRERYDYLLAGREGDVPADPRSAKLLARRLLELGTSAVLDLYDLSLPDRRRFVRLFLDELMHLPRTLWRPVLVVIDEAHVFCPERGSGEAESTDAVIALCTQGRKRGYAAVLATQRLSKLHKDAAAELLNKLVGRTGLDVDVKRAGDDLGFDKDQRHTLKSLVPGTFYAYGPAIASSVTLVRTGDVRTSHPEAGTVSAPPPPAPAAIQRVLGELRDLPKQAEEEARSVADLARQLADARAKLARAERQGVERVVEKLVPDPAAIAAAVEAATTEVDRHWRHAVLEADRKIDEARAIFDAARGARIIPRAPQPAPTPRLVRPAVHPAPAVPVPRATSNGAAPSSAGLSRTQQRMLNALAFFADLGQDATSRAAVAGLIGVTHTAGSYSNNLSALRTSGLIEDRAGGMLALTPAGRAVVTERPDVATRADLHALWMAHPSLSGTQRRMVAELIAAYPRAVSRTALADAIGVTASSGSFSNNLSKLRTMGLMDDPSRTEVRASALLFPDGLR